MKKDIPAPKQKQYYDVQIQCMLPATITYKVLAESPEEAALLYKTYNPSNVKYKLIGKKDLKMQIYETGKLIIKFIKNL